MPITARSKTRVRRSAYPLAVRLAVLFIALCSSGKVLCAQTINIKLVNGKTGRAIANTCVNIWVGTERKDAMLIQTDEDGVASLRLTDKDVEINTQERTACGGYGVVDPAFKYASSIQINAGYVLCQVVLGNPLGYRHFSFKRHQLRVDVQKAIGPAKRHFLDSGLTANLRLAWIIPRTAGASHSSSAFADRDEETLVAFYGAASARGFL
jgi:hypothetical protein